MRVRQSSQLISKQLITIQQWINAYSLIPVTLSKREIACLFLAAHGKAALETAEILLLQKQTIYAYYKQIRRKLKCRTIAQAVFMVFCTDKKLRSSQFRFPKNSKDKARKNALACGSQE